MFDTTTRDRAIQARRERLEEERRELLAAVRRRLVAIRDRYQIAAAYVVGSLAAPDHWHADSDVDVAVRGCTPHILAVMKEIEEVAEREVDVVDLDRHPAVAQLVEVGTIVYG